ncbi:transmembrane protein 205 [Onthophagus taurus]|uniref:transmembrane protein 205 n=1 Tax=Onthophagus taurus TaxID=166361 RepID=UPI000C20E48E|nr:transmembrane protein 205 [Onthophagus taurus]
MCVSNAVNETIPHCSNTSVKKPTSSTSEDHFRDILYESTKQIKSIFYQFDAAYKKCQRSAYYRVLFNTTQPAHLVTIVAISIIGFFVYPSEKTNQPSKLWNFLHLTAFCVHLGTQIWMTFVSGLSLYFALPRHDFGRVQEVLFPKYFLLNSILSLITLVIYLRYHNSQLGNPEILLQVSAMSTCFLTELVIRLYFTPPLLRLMAEKNSMERRVGVGKEIGSFEGEKLASSTDYLRVHKAFRKIHMKIAMGNILTMVCTVIHLLYLSNKICIL